jgi:hypothetical protein
MLTFAVIIQESLKEATSIFFDYWWLFSFVIIWPTFQAMWVTYVQEKYIRKIKWNLLEIKVSAELEKRPKTMEEFFVGLASNFDTAIDTLYDVYLSGVVDTWFSFEIVSFEGDIHFYVRTPSVNRDYIESQIYGVYPEAEIQEVEDYTVNVPDDVPNEDYDIWGTDMKLAKDSAFPLRTYKEFEDPASGEFIDPLGPIVEGVNKLGPGEQFWIQILVRPTNDDWKKSARAITYKLAGKPIKEAPKEGFLDKLSSEVIDIGRHVLFDYFNPNLSGGGATEEKKPDLPSMLLHLTPGELDAIKAIDEKIKKPGFETDIRYIYAAKRSNFNKGKGNSVMFSYFTQFGTEFLNRLGPDGKTKTSAYYFFPEARKAEKKKKIMKKYKARTLDVQSYVLASDELATMYHFPTIQVKGPVVPHVEAKKGKPPATLPI